MLGRAMDQQGDTGSSSGVPANTSSPPPPPSSTCGSSGSVGVGVGGGESLLVPVVLDELTFDNRQVRRQTRIIYTVSHKKRATFIVCPMQYIAWDRI